MQDITITCLRNSVNSIPELSEIVILQADEDIGTIRVDGNSGAECDRSIADVFGMLSAPSLSDAHAIHIVDLHSVTVSGTVDILM
jgi:hypothetical protein